MPHPYISRSDLRNVARMLAAPPTKGAAPVPVPRLLGSGLAMAALGVFLAIYA